MTLAHHLHHGLRPTMPLPLAQSTLAQSFSRLPAAAEAAAAPRLPSLGAAAGTASEREALSPLARCMAHMLDEIDYGMVLVDAQTRVIYVNHIAQRELDEQHPLQITGQQLGTTHAANAGELQDALAEAQRGLRQLLRLANGDQVVTVSVVPLNEPGTPAGTTLLVLGKRRVCEQLTVQGYARAVSLTPAETRVLELLCCGEKPTAIALQQGVAVSTVRTQIGSIRAKTGANSIRELVRQVAVLPPLVGVLRSSAAAFMRAPLARYAA